VGTVYNPDQNVCLNVW